MLVGCDGIFKTCDVLAWAGENAARECANCAASGAQFFTAFGLSLIQLRSFLTEKDFTEAADWAAGVDPGTYATARYDSLPIGAWVTSSVFSYFRINEIGRAHV